MPITPFDFDSPVNNRQVFKKIARVMHVLQQDQDRLCKTKTDVSSRPRIHDHIDLGLVSEHFYSS